MENEEPREPGQRSGEEGPPGTWNVLPGQRPKPRRWSAHREPRGPERGAGHTAPKRTGGPGDVLSPRRALSAARQPPGNPPEGGPAPLTD